MLPRAVGSAAPAGGTTVRVMSANLFAGQADAGFVVDLVREQSVDVLALQEVTPEAVRALSAAGLDTVLPYAEAHPYRGVDGSAVYSRHPILAGSVKINPGVGFRQASAVISIAEHRFVVESVHPVSPSNGEVAGFWAEGLRDQATPMADPAGPRVLAGDFNATLDHAELRRLLATGYRDAADQVGRGLVPTWPFSDREYRTIPRVTIDHILVPEPFGVVDFTVATVPGTDHRAIIATLVLPRPDVRPRSRVRDALSRTAILSLTPQPETRHMARALSRPAARRRARARAAEHDLHGRAAGLGRSRRARAGPTRACGATLRSPWRWCWWLGRSPSTRSGRIRGSRARSGPRQRPIRPRRRP